MDNLLRSRIRERVAALGTNPFEVARKAELERGFVNDLLIGKKNSARPAALQAIARALAVPLDYLIDENYVLADEYDARLIVQDPEGEEPARGLPTSSPMDGMTVIPEYDIKISAGGGVAIDREDIKANWQVPTALIRHELHRNPEHLSMVEVTGDSMAPKLLPGDRILVDHSDKNPTPPGVFALWDGYGLVVKNIHRIHKSDPEKVTLISENGIYAPYDVLLDDIHIVGRVIWFSRKM